MGEDDPGPKQPVREDMEINYGRIEFVVQMHWLQYRNLVI
jgi:hypothetical protein